MVVFGKSWDFQVTDILKATLEENLAIIWDTVVYLKTQGRTVIYDAEHFFYAWKANKDSTIKILAASVDGGASVLVLCDTNLASRLRWESIATTTVIWQWLFPSWRWRQELSMCKGHCWSLASEPEMQT